MTRLETLLKGVLASVLFPGLLFLLAVFGAGVVTAKTISTKLIFAGLFVFLGAGGIVAIRILLHRPAAFVARLREHPPGTPEFLEVGFQYIRSRSLTLKLTAGFCLVLGVLHLALPFFSDLSAGKLVLIAVTTFGLPMVTAYLLMRREAAGLKLVRAARHLSVADQQRALLLLASHRPERDRVSSIIVAELEALGVEAAWPNV